MNLASDITIALLFVLGALALSMGAYLLTRFLTRSGSHERHKEMAGAIVNRIGVLHGLIIALVFAQEMAAYQRLETQAAVEASAVADVFNDAVRYDPVALASVRENMRDYLRIVVDREWAGLGAGQGLDADAWDAWESAYDTVLDLTPQASRQISLRDHMLSSLHAIASARDQRKNESDTSIANLFWFAALSGVILIAAGLYIYPPERQSIMLIVLYSAYTGVILFLIYGFSNPFSSPVALSPVSLQELATKLTLELDSAGT